MANDVTKEELKDKIQAAIAELLLGGTEVRDAMEDTVLADGEFEAMMDNLSIKADQRGIILYRGNEPLFGTDCYHNAFTIGNMFMSYAVASMVNDIRNGVTPHHSVNAEGSGEGHLAT